MGWNRRHDEWVSNVVLLKVPYDEINNDKINTKNVINLDKQELEKIFEVQVHEEVFTTSKEYERSSELDKIIINVKQDSLRENTDGKESPMKESVQKEPVTSEETSLSQPVTSKETNLSQPMTSEETNLSQPMTSEETNLSQPMTSGETSLRQPVTSRESNDEMYDSEEKVRKVDLTKRNIPVNSRQSLKPAYPNGVRINWLKYKDLMQLLKFIPPVYHDDYKAIRRDKSEEDELFSEEI